MKLNEILNNDNHSIDEIVAILKRDCAPIIAEYNNVGVPLSRGIQDSNIPPMTVIHPSLDSRSPKDTNITIHNYINDYFTKHAGLPFRNAIFATSDWEVAEVYGEAYVLFPIGPLKYLWSPQVGDLYDTVSKLESSKDADPAKKYDQQFYQKLDQYLSTYISKNLHAALEDGSEVMIANNCYVVTMDLWFDHLEEALS
jgi:hypothetical protein